MEGLENDFPADARDYYLGFALRESTLPRQSNGLAASVLEQLGAGWFHWKSIYARRYCATPPERAGAAPPSRLGPPSRPPNVAVLTRESPSEARVSSAFNTQLGGAGPRRSGF